MNRRAAGISMCALALFSFLSRYAFALWYPGDTPTRWGADDFATHVGYVGLGPWFVAAALLLAGIAFLASAERES
ncbi:hypothetical protein [Lacipirellula parvula]|uniref:Uncharacterized protein n=1 Tax=Lacipirellula parvula TaxID=2650471 RepID=A0A5K7XDK6_9BACT|nr:hypothetical protein [Lacipirellula parvula]BBO32921.1 hypothetical protein PLANPX_2533 [Lacipirellula parvula]